MSLVSTSEANNWRVVLRDESRKALVLYDNSSKKISLVNDPETFNRFYDYYRRNNNGSMDSDRVSNRFLQFLSNQNGASPSSTSGSGMICSNCGQYIPQSGPTAAAGRRLSHEHVVRDANYFKLLQAGEEDVESDIEEQEEPVYASISQSAFSQGYFDRFFVSKQDLGRGSRGVVHLVEHLLDGVSLGLFALKKVPVGDDHIWLEKVLSEVHLLKLLSHPNLVSYNHVWLENSQLSKFGPSVPCAFILQEYCNGGTLEDYIRHRQVQGLNSTSSKRERVRRKSMGQEYYNEISCLEQLLTPHEIFSFFTDITAGIKHLHQNQIIHRDIKPSNCLLSKNSVPDEPPRVLVSDFGEGQLEGIHRSETGSTGTLEYCAPELISVIDGHLAQFSKKTDVFSLGMVLHYLCFSRLPYSTNPWEERIDIDALKNEVQNYGGFDMSGYTGFVRTDLPQEIYSLLSRMLSVTPDERPDTPEILVELSRIQGEDEETARIRILSEPTEDATHIPTVDEQNSMQLVTRQPAGPPTVVLEPPPPPPPPAVSQHKKHVTLPTFALFKSLLFILKLVSYTHLSSAYPKEILILLMGIEIPLMTLTGSLAMFLLHWLVVAATKLFFFLNS
jgi:serine/threonine protein kinase